MGDIYKLSWCTANVGGFNRATLKSKTVSF